MFGKVDALPIHQLEHGLLGRPDDEQWLDVPLAGGDEKPFLGREELVLHTADLVGALFDVKSYGVRLTDGHGRISPRMGDTDMALVILQIRFSAGEVSDGRSDTQLMHQPAHGQPLEAAAGGLESPSGFGQQLLTVGQGGRQFLLALGNLPDGEGAGWGWRDG